MLRYNDLPADLLALAQGLALLALMFCLTPATPARAGEVKGVNADWLEFQRRFDRQAPPWSSSGRAGCPGGRGWNTVLSVPMVSWPRGLSISSTDAPCQPGDLR
ncbi:MAG: hypothetical protein ACK5HY_13850 [Parahaliea sp.]